NANHVKSRCWNEERNAATSAQVRSTSRENALSSSGRRRGTCADGSRHIMAATQTEVMSASQGSTGCTAPCSGESAGIASPMENLGKTSVRREKSQRTKVTTPLDVNAPNARKKPEPPRHSQLP